MCVWWRDRARMCVCVCVLSQGVCVCLQRRRHVSHYHYGDKLKDRMGAPGEIAAKKAAEECVAISGMTGRGCPAPVIWKVLHLSLSSRHWPTNSARQISIMLADRICPSKWAAEHAVVLNCEWQRCRVGPTRLRLFMALEKTQIAWVNPSPFLLIVSGQSPADYSEPFVAFLASNILLFFAALWQLEILVLLCRLSVFKNSSFSFYFMHL